MNLSSGDKRNVMLGVDIGTTNLKCYAYDHLANVIGKSEEQVNLLNPDDDRLEIIPEVLWQDFQKAIKKCLFSANLHASDVACLGISTQRSTFLTWDRETSRPFHNFISWKDKRAKDICNKWNSSIFMKLFRFGAFLLYLFTRKTKFQIYSALKFSSAMVLTRLYWILEHYPEIRNKCSQDQVLYGTIDTWLLWKLTGGKIHATDPSNACVTGFFDPFRMKWNSLVLWLFDIPRNILPVVKNTCDSFGETLPAIFGSAIPICCLIGDQQASMFGACCFEKNDVNCTMGTGSFLTINVGSTPCVSNYGIVPLVGWSIHSQTTYMAECGVYNTGTIIMWMQKLGFFSDPHDSSSVAQSVSDAGGVLFFPAVELHQMSESGNDISSSFVGLRTNTTKEHLVRSVLESLAFQVCSLFNVVCKMYGDDAKMNFRISGGIAKNDFIVQLIADITGHSVHRLKHNETSSLGAAFLAGLHHGIWKSPSDLTKIYSSYDVFSPNTLSSKIHLKAFKNWKKASKLQRVIFP